MTPGIIIKISITDRKDNKFCRNCSLDARHSKSGLLQDYPEIYDYRPKSYDFGWFTFLSLTSSSPASCDPHMNDGGRGYVGPATVTLFA